MTPQEEYLRRKKIDRVPFLFFRGRGTLIAAADPFYALKIEWKTEPGSTGFYRMSLNSPRLDRGGSLCEDASWLFEYDESEREIVETIAALPHPIVPDKMLRLAAWEMFLLSYRTWISRQERPLSVAIAGSLDPSRPIDCRERSMEDAASMISRLSIDIHGNLVNVFLGLEKTNLGWLSEILRRRRDGADR